MWVRVNQKGYKARDRNGKIKRHSVGDQILLHGHLAAIEAEKGKVTIVSVHNPEPQEMWVKVKATGQVRRESLARVPQLVSSGIVERMDTDADGFPKEKEKKRGPGRPRKDA
jgi:hypothetical protein